MTVAFLDREAVGFDPLAQYDFGSLGLGEPIVDYLASKELVGRSEATLYDKRRYLGSFAFAWPKLTIDRIETRHCAHWLAQQPAGETRRTRRSHLNDFLDWCVDFDLILKNPLARLEQPPRAKKKVYDTFTDSEIERLVGLPLIDGALMETMISAGLRKSECVALKPRHVRQRGDRTHISVIGGKGGKDRLVPCSRELESKLALLHLEAGMGENDFFWYTRVNQGRSIKRNRELGDGSFYRWWERSLKSAGVRYRNPHMTRHTFATRWLQRRGRLETLSLVMGHESIQTTKDLYGHLDVRDVVADLELMED